jgi:hypothetical protein
MATTTNYSWTTPDDTALVKDGAAAIRSLGSSIDTTTKALNPETTLGDLAYRSSTANVKTRLALGTANQVLAVNSGATAPEWVTLSAGGMTLISETSASALSSLSFSSLGSYKQLLMLWTGIVHSAGSTAFNIRLNNDSASNYTIKQVYANNTTIATLNASYTSLNGDNNAGFGYDVTSANIQNQAGGWLLIDNYTSTTKFKEYTGQWGYIEAGGGKNDVLSNTGTYRSASAVTSIDIVRSTGAGTFSNTANTTIRLYGIN